MGEPRVAITRPPCLRMYGTSIAMRNVDASIIRLRHTRIVYFTEKKLYKYYEPFNHCRSNACDIVRCDFNVQQL